MSKNTLKDLCDTIKWTNICVIGGSRSRRKRGRRKLSQRNITDSFPNVMKETDNENLGSTEKSPKDKSKQPHIETHYNCEMLKERTLKAAGKNFLCTKEPP